MTNSRLVVPLAALAGLVLLVVAGIYIAEPERSLPSFFPGQAPNSNHHHITHGIAALVVALALFIFAWFASGPRRTTAA